MATLTVSVAMTVTVTVTVAVAVTITETVTAHGLTSALHDADRWSESLRNKPVNVPAE